MSYEGMKARTDSGQIMMNQILAVFVFTTITFVANLSFSQEIREVNATVDQILLATSVVIDWPKTEGNLLFLARNAQQVYEDDNEANSYRVKAANAACEAIGLKGSTNFKPQMVYPSAGGLLGSVTDTYEKTLIPLSIRDVAKVVIDGGSWKKDTYKEGQPYEVFAQLRCRK